MATWRPENSMLTKTGVEILNKIKAGVGSITVTRVVAGSSRVTESQLYNQTSIKGSVLELPISGKKTGDSGTELSVYFINDELHEAFNVHQIGVYVTHPDYTGEQLYHISQCDEIDFDVIPPVEINPVTFGYSLYLEHGNSSSITIVVDSQGFITEATFNTFIGNLRPEFLVATDHLGNLKVSGNNMIGATRSLIVSDAKDHRMLSLSISGTTNQLSPSVSIPTPFISTKVHGVRTRGKGKNLFNIKATPLKVSSDKYGSITHSLSSFSTMIMSGAKTPYLGYLIPTTVNRTYTISYTLVSNSTISYVEIDKPISNLDSISSFGTDLSASTTYTATKPYLLICVRPKSVKAGQTYGMSKVQVELGSSATDYEDYVGKTVLLPSVIELNHLSRYSDTIEWDGSKWWKVQRVGELVMDGTTYKVYHGVAENSQTYTRLGLVKSGVPITDVLVNTPTATTHGNSAVSNTADLYAYYNKSSSCLACHFLNATFGLTGSQSATERADAINNWLVSQYNAGNPLKVRYILPAPIITEISVTEVLEMYSESTEVTVISDVYDADFTLDYVLDSTDPTIMYILKSLARKSDVQTANTFALATLVEEED